MIIIQRRSQKYTVTLKYQEKLALQVCAAIILENSTGNILCTFVIAGVNTLYFNDEMVISTSYPSLMTIEEFDRIFSGEK